jgi:hypothetical protein
MKKHISAKLTSFEKLAVIEAANGNYANLEKAIIDACRAIASIHSVSNDLTSNWGESMLEYYREKKRYLTFELKRIKAIHITERRKNAISKKG